METQNDFSPKPVPETKSGDVQEVTINVPVEDKPKSGGGFKGFYGANKIYIWIFLAGVIIIAAMSFFAFRKTPPVVVKEANVKVEFTSDTPQTAVIGGNMVYRIKITNLDNQTLTNVQLELTYPDGFTYVASSPSKADNLSGSLISLTDLPPNVPVVVTVQTKAGGAINDNKTLDVKLHYKYANFNSEFIKEQSYTVRLTSSDVALNLTGPSNTNNTEVVSYVLTYQNNSPSEIKNARIQLTYPDGFNFSQASPQPDIGSNIWNFSSLAVGGNGQIKITGSFQSANPGETKTLNADFMVLGDNGQYQDQVSSSYNTAILSLPLLVSQSLAQGSLNGNIVNPGDSISYNVHYQNNNTVVARGVIITVTLDSKALDLSKTSAQGGVINNNTITWNASGVPNLENLAPNDSGDLNFTVHVNNPAVRDSSNNLTVVSHVKIISDEYQTPFPGGDLTIKVASPISVKTALQYVSGQKPPQVGKTTVYMVTLSLLNATNDYNNAAVTAFVPAGFVVDSFNSQEKNFASYDPSTNKVTWNIGTIPAHSGQFNSSRFLSFNISFNPSAAQANTIPVLVKGINLQATDNFTQKDISVNADDLNTGDLPGQDSYFQGEVQQ